MKVAVRAAGLVLQDARHADVGSDFPSTARASRPKSFAD